MGQLTRDEIIEYLNGDEVKTGELFRLAKERRNEIFGNKIFLYGFVYFSTWCRNNCNFCYFRRSNSIGRYRKSKEEVVQIARELAESGVNLIDLTMGEDPQYHAEGFQTVLEIVDLIKNELKMPVMISPGVIGMEIIDKFAELDTDWYALYQETHNQELFKKLRVNQEYHERMASKLYARQKGMLIEEGLLAGIGESVEDIADSLIIMGEIGASQVRVMSFVPQDGSPMADMEGPNRIMELKIIALLRLLYPHALIPASLDVDGIKGLESRVNAGANVVTSIIPPRIGLMGVAQSKMDVDEGGRTTKEAREILERMGLKIASTDEYVEYLGQLRAMRCNDGSSN
ncbi:MAG TPA: methylornithine synthase PylB [Anaerovoracaceae bacterium]|nr:methylornithine synthase PylB [Anaerovoracaceae bacterium]